ncbi:tetratricopeptide repeat protein [Streptomyces sp. NPDC092369]|uniref:tetratricopeptide repeat protein n=1 Tax=Streptomyces sp. NPDC092369 TaxID=3366015 RepID=UPI0037FF6255
MSRRGWFSARKWFQQGVALAAQGKLEEARDAYLRAAEANSVNAQYNLGLLYIDLGDRDSAILWFRRAAAAGDAGAMHSLALQLADGDRQATRETLHWYTEASARGHAPSQYNLGLHYQATGELPVAERYFEQAAKQKHLDAEVSLAGLWLARGRRREAEEILRRAADREHPGALSFMGDLAWEGGDTVRAAGFYVRSHAAGFSGAAVNLGLMYERQQRVTEGEEWLRKAADAGNAGGMYALGRLLVGLDRADEALAWFRRSADLGDAQSRQALRVLGAREEE